MEDEAARIRRHVLGRAEVDVASLDVARLAGVRLRRETHARHGLHPLDRLEHRRRADRAVDANHGRATLFQLRREPFGRRAVEGVPVLFGGHLRDDRQVGQRPNGVDRRADFVQVAKGLEDEEIDAAVEKGAGLLSEVVARLVDAGLAPRLDSNPERPDRSGDIGALAGRAPRNAHPLDVDSHQRFCQAERPQLDPVGTEGVGLDNVRAGADVFLVHFLDEVGTRQVQRVEALVDEHALRVQHRPHRPIADEDTLIQGFDEWLHHSHYVSNRSHLKVCASMIRYDLVTISRPIERTP
jgi:hypothetical protein